MPPIKAIANAGLYDIALDPGFGFGKTTDHNLALLARLVIGPGAGLPDKRWPLELFAARLVTESGATYRLLGVNRSGGEFACIQGRGMWDGPMDQASVTAMRSWNVRAVRVALNEECWLGTANVPAGGRKKKL